jgi:tetratricopeptide (TPR) repeat protein
LRELEQAAQAYESYGDLAGAVTTAAKIGETHFLRGTSEEGLQRVRPLISRLEQDEDLAVPGECAATLYLSLALLSWAVTRFDEQLEAAERARQLAQQDRTRVDAEVRRVQAMIGRAEEALHALEAILPTAEQLDDLELRRRALAMAAVLCEGTGRVERCIDYRRRALAVAERSGNPAMIATSLSHLGGILGWSGHWAEARSCYERAVANFCSLPASFYAAWPLLGLSGVSWWSGDLESGWAYANEAREIAESDGNMEASWHAHNGLAEIELLRGQPEAAYERIHSFLSQPQLATADPLYVADAYPLYAKVSLAAGHHERAEEISAAAVALNRQANLLVALCEALWVRGMVLASQARWQEAESHFEEAVSIARSLPHPRQEALALHEYGAMLVASDQAERGRARLEEALTVFRRLGARLDADRTERMLAELGPSARQASRRAP